MKFATIAVSFALIFGGTAVHAQTCASPGGPAVDSSFTANGDTCGDGNEFAQVCSGGNFTTGSTNVYAVQIGSGNNFTATVTPSDPTYDTAIYFIGPNNCSQSAACGGSADGNGAGAAESISLSGIATGTWYLVVGSTQAGDTAGSAGCGNYAVSFSGTLPVKLQNFSVN